MTTPRKHTRYQKIFYCIFLSAAIFVFPVFMCAYIDGFFVYIIFLFHVYFISVGVCLYF